MLETIAFALATIAVCLSCIFMGRDRLPLVGAVTFVGWVYYLTIQSKFGFSVEQVLLSLGDLAQASAIVICMRKDGRHVAHILGMSAVFMFMIGCHASLFEVEHPAKQHYHTALNWAYVAQLSILFLMVAGDLAKSRSHAVRDFVRSLHISFSRVVHK